jgi:hypothetical protein
LTSLRKKRGDSPRFFLGQILLCQLRLVGHLKLRGNTDRKHVIATGVAAMSDNSKTTSTPSNGLRLVKDTQEAESTPKPATNNKLIQFMSAYADAIDQEIKTILEL